MFLFADFSGVYKIVTLKVKNENSEIEGRLSGLPLQMCYQDMYKKLALQLQRNFSEDSHTLK